MSKIVADGLLVCDDCTMAIANDDYTGMDDATETRVRAGISRLAHNLKGYPVIGDDQGFSWRNCHCCGGLAGNRHECSILGD